MLAGPDLLVVLVIAVVVIGPKKLPEVAKTLGKALAEFRRTSDDIKNTIGIKELTGFRSSLSDMDLLTDLPEKVSASMASKEKPIDQTAGNEASSETEAKHSSGGEETGKQEQEPRTSNEINLQRQQQGVKSG